jgi:hypothetical protein
MPADQPQDVGGRPTDPRGLVVSGEGTDRDQAAKRTPRHSASSGTSTTVLAARPVSRGEGIGFGADLPATRRPSARAHDLENA